MSTYVRNMSEAMERNGLYNNISDILKYKGLNIQDIEYLMPFAERLKKKALMEFIVVHPLVTIEWMTERAHVNWTDLDNIMLNPNVTKENIKKYPNFGWDWQYMDKLSDFDSNFVLSNKNEKLELAAFVSHYGLHICFGASRNELEPCLS